MWRTWTAVVVVVGPVVVVVDEVRWRACDVVVVVGVLELAQAARTGVAHATRASAARRKAHPSKSSGRTESRNWRNCPTSSSGVSSSSSSASSASRIPSDSISSSDTNSGASVRTAMATASDGRLETTVCVLALEQMQLGVVGRRAQLGDDDALHRDAERAEHVLHQVVRERPGHDDALERVGDGRRLRAPDEDRQRAPLALGLLQQQDRGVRLQVHPDRSEQHTDHD